MVYLRDVRNQLLFSHNLDLIDDEEFVCLYELNKSKNLDFPYWNYAKFDIESLTDAECWSEFRFYRSDVYRLQEILQIPDELHTYNRLLVDGTEALCIFLKRFSYPCRYSEMIPRFGRPVPQYSIISNQIMDHILTNFGHLLEDLNQPWLSNANLENFSNAVHNKGAALDNCWGFVDGTVRPVCRPTQMQRSIYNGHKKVHAIKFQSVVAANSMI